MGKLGRGIVAGAVLGVTFWIALTSPTLKQCLQEEYPHKTYQPFPYNIPDLYSSLVGFRFCIGEFIHQNGEGIIAIFTVILGVATWLLWGATRDLVAGAEKAIAIVERPYVIINARTNHSDIKATIDVRILNYGRSIAFLGTLQGDFFTQTTPPPQFKPVRRHEKGISAILPSENNGIELAWAHRKPEQDIRDVTDGKTNLYFLAVVTYQDGGGKWHETGICNIFDVTTKGMSVAGDASHNFMT